jgi:hypothetical protein
MEYNLELQFLKLNANLYFSDRFGNILKTDITRCEDLICTSTFITLPNKITVEILPTQEELNIKLVGVCLGKIKFNNNALEKIFIYYHPYGQSRSCDWNFGGKVEFEFFEHSAIKYHLIMGTTI